MNDTLATHDDTVDVVAWIVVPLILGLLIYATLALFTWPYARARVSPWLLILCILIPPLFPFLLVFVLFTVCFPPVVAVPSDVIVPSQVYVVETRGRVRAPQQGRRGGSSV